jgi:hypothetical protein
MRSSNDLSRSIEEFLNLKSEEAIMVCGKI